MCLIVLSCSFSAFAGTCELTKRIGPSKGSITPKFMATQTQIERKISIRDCIAIATESVGTRIDSRDKSVRGGISKRNNTVKFVLYKFSYRNGKIVRGRIEK